MSKIRVSQETNIKENDYDRAVIYRDLEAKAEFAFVACM
jgi:hypothetical protein